MKQAFTDPETVWRRRLRLRIDDQGISRERQNGSRYFQIEYADRSGFFVEQF